MTNVVKKTLPNGNIPFVSITDGKVRSVIMQLNENIKSLKAQLETAQTAIIELQRGNGGGGEPEEYLVEAGVSNHTLTITNNDGDDTTVSASTLGAIANPSQEGTNGQMLTTDGNGGRTWTTPQAVPDQYLVRAGVSSDGKTLTVYDNNQQSYSLTDTHLTESEIETMGFTKNEGTITDVQVGGTSVATSGVANITDSHISGLGFTKNEGTITDVQVGGTSVATSGVANIIDSHISGLGFTKNEGTITDVQVGGTSVATSGVANITNLSEVQDYSTGSASHLQTLKFAVVDNLPASPVSDVFYFVKET